ncbi:MAG: CHAT domain-containing protein [Sphingomonadaceae bacterium]|nr:CHAT domain-containing protein [Sphingomonadaceae bacterium]
MARRKQVTGRLCALLLAGAAMLPFAAPVQAQHASLDHDGRVDADLEVERYNSAIIAADEGEEVETAIALFRFLEQRGTEVSDSAYNEAGTTILIHMALGYDPKDVRGQIRRYLDGRIAEFESRGDAFLELRFRVLRYYFLPKDMRLGEARLIHRKAAEKGMLDSHPAGQARSWIAVASDDLLEEGRIEEALQAQDDTFYELELAGLDKSLPSWSQKLDYAETLTLARRDEDADALFEHLFSISAPGSRELQLAQNQAAFYRNIAGRFAAAEKPGEYAAREGERLLSRASIATQKARYNYALALLGQGKAEQSLPYFEEALPLQREAEANSWTGHSARADTIILLTTLARARAQVPGHEEAALDAAEEAAERLRERKRKRLESSQEADPASAAIARAIAKGDRRDPLSSGYDMVLFAGWAARNLGDRPLDSAFRAAQDLTLSDAGNAISEAAARDIAGDGPLGDLVRERQDIAAAIVAGTQAYRDTSLSSNTDAASQQRDELDQLGKRLAVLDAQLQRDFPDYNALVSPQSMSVADLQKILAPDEVMLLILPSEGSHYIFAISATAAKWHRIDDGAEAISGLVGRLKCRIDEATCDVDELEAAYAAEDRSAPSPIDEYFPRYDRAAAYDLYRILIAPVADVLPEGGRVYTVASGPIAGLPLAVLAVSPPQNDPESGIAADLQATDWLGRHMAFITLPSVSALGLAQRMETQAADDSDRPPLIAYGAPELLGSGTAAARGGDEQRRRRGGASVRAANLTWADGERTMASVDKLRRLDPLPGTLEELRNLAADISRGTGLRMGRDATESAVKADRDLPRARTVVFATHGLLPGEMGVGSEPGLVLTPPQTASLLDDGLLTASEAANLSLSARWVVLSACNTATPGARDGGGESLSSLARSFLYAGAQNLLASHWRVADDATAALTVETLSSRDLTPALALARAMEVVRSGKHPDGSPVKGWKPHWAHPASWAPFTLITNRDR